MSDDLECYKGSALVLGLVIQDVNGNALDLTGYSFKSDIPTILEVNPNAVGFAGTAAQGVMLSR